MESNIRNMQSLTPHTLQRTCVHDGPGIRTVIFFEGCNLRCRWCQNPEMQALSLATAPERRYSTDEMRAIILRDKAYYHASGGGVTLSGGEPLLQDPDSMAAFLQTLRDDDIHIAAETSLHAPWHNIETLLPYIDLFLVDLKVVGDASRHKECTGHDDVLIQDNLRRLMASGANVHFRMVMVPGFNDDETHLRAAAELLLSLGHDTVELLKYHALHEEKAAALGVKTTPLAISDDQSLAAVETGLRVFKACGVQACYTDREKPPAKAHFTPRVTQIQQNIRNSDRALCMEACNLKTDYYKRHGFNKPTPIHRAECLAHVLRHKSIHVYPGELLVGNFTAKRVAGQLWAEYYGFVGVKMIHKITRLKPVPFQVSVRERLAFLKSLPFWMKHSLLGRVYPKVADYLLMFARASEMNAGFNNNLAAIAHFIINFERILTLGTSGLIETLREKQQQHPENNRHFYEGAIIALHGLEAFAQRYADHLTALSNHEADPQRRAELAEMADICAHVPKFPARTFHEALQSMVLLHIALCTESYENAISFGRLDRLLLPYYQQDLEAGRITYEKAKELLCLFVLKMDEAILVNDGNTFPELFTLFETLSTDQAYTFGGVDEHGKDVTNDLTYMLLDTCQLQPLAADPAARIHKDSPDTYLERLAATYINGCPLPQVFSDDIYIETLRRHYPVTSEQARNYAIVGCVEPNASDDHFGNTDCANVNVTLPLLQAIKGHDHDLWNYGAGDQLLLLTTNYLCYMFPGKNILSRGIRRACAALRRRRNARQGAYVYDPPANMAELLERFQTRLNTVTASILADHQKIEDHLRRHFTTPLASSLFPGCVESGRDVYEGGAGINSSGIQAVGVTDAADSLHALDEVVFKQQRFTITDVINAMEHNFSGPAGQEIKDALLAVPKFGDDDSTTPATWVSTVMAMFNTALDAVERCPRNGRYSAGYYALNVGTRYGKNTPALPSGRLAGVPLANSIIPHYGMQKSDLASALNAVADIDFVEHAENGATATFSIDAALFQGDRGVKNLAAMFKTFLTTGGMQLQPNVLDRRMLLEAYDHPEKYPDLIVRIAGYCAYFNELSDEMKRVVINRTCYH